MKNKSTLKPLIGIALVVALAAASFLLLDGADAAAAAELTAGEIPVTVESVQTTADEVQAELCIEMPTLDQWFPEASLTVAGTTIPNRGWSLVNAKDPDVMKTARRCYVFRFPVTAEQSAAGIGTLKLERLSREIEGGLLSEAGEAAAKERLLKDHPEIEFEVVIVHGEGGGGAYVDFLSKPEGMSEEEALQLVREAAEEEIPVGWEAEIDL
jgi:hypothetical protein